MRIKTFEAKLANMRKPQEFVVYPRKNHADTIKIQSDKSIGQFDPVTGEGVLNTKGQYFVHLAMGVPYTLPADVLALALQCGVVNDSGTICIVGNEVQNNTVIFE